MIALARSQKLRDLMQGSRFLAGLAGQFVGGADAEATVQKVKELRSKNIRASLYYLGEYVDDPSLVEQNVNQKKGIVERLAAGGQEVHLSIDTTQIGYELSDETGANNAQEIGRIFQKHTNGKPEFLMLDMEDYSLVQKTLDLRSQLVANGISTAITIQAYLHRSEDDIRALVAEGAAIRLVKGAFVEKKERARTHKQEIDDNYLRLAEIMTSKEAQTKGVYPVFGTHDTEMIDAIIHMLSTNGWGHEGYEFEMLHGVRTPLQQRLANEGHRVRVYLPFGTAWWPYTARRVGENPANVLFVARALLQALFQSRKRITS